jgi:protocatechuate 3,4-dioxygenase beta subunit
MTAFDRSSGTIAAIGLLALLAPAPVRLAAIAAAPLRPGAPANTLAVTAPDEPGTRLTVTGLVRGKDGRPIAGAELHVYQTDATGRYTREKPMDEPHARLSGRLRTGSDGRFVLHTIRPGGYPQALLLGGRMRKIPAHVHIDVTAPGRSEQRFQMVFADDPNFADPYWQDWARKPGRPQVVAHAEKDGSQSAALVLAIP